MKKLLSFLLVGILSATLFTNQVSAQSGLPKMNRKSFLDSLTPEQKQALRKSLRARYDSLSPAEKEAFKKKLLERADSTLTPQQKARLRRRLKNTAPAGNG
jgi:hypothetical protein